MEKTMMIDIHKENGEGFIRMSIDNMEFCVRDGYMYFISDGVRYSIPLSRCCQVFTT